MFHVISDSERDVILTKKHPLRFDKPTLNLEEKLADRPKDSAMNCKKTKHSQISVEKGANQGHFDEYIEAANVPVNGADNGV